MACSSGVVRYLLVPYSCLLLLLLLLRLGRAIVLPSSCAVASESHALKVNSENYAEQGCC